MDIKEILAGALKDVEGADIDSIADDLNKEIAKGYMPRAKFNEVNEELKTTKEQLDKTNLQVEELSKSTEATDELKQKYETIQSEYKKYQEEADLRVLNLQKKTAVEKELSKRNANAEAIDLLIPLFELDKIQIDKSGAIVDSDDVFNPIVESKATLFGTPVKEGNEPPQGNNNQVDVSKMSDTEYMNYKLSQN